MNTIIQMMFLLSKQVKGFLRKITSTFPITCVDCVDEDSLINMSIEGNSYQDGEPSYDNPIEIQSVGERTANILPYPYSDTTITKNGITSTDNEDGSVTITGTSTGTCNFFLAKSPNNIQLVDGKRYVLKNNSATVRLILSYIDETGATKYITSINGVASFVWSESYTIQNIYITTVSGVTINETIYPMFMEADTEVDGYEPYGYKIPIVATSNDGSKSIATNIYLKEPLRAVNLSYADKLDVKNGVCTRNIKIEQLDKNTGFLWRVLNNTPLITYKLNDAYIPENYSDMVICSHYLNNRNDAYYGRSNSVFLDTTKYLRIYHEGITTLDEYKELLGDEIIDVAYVIAEPITEKIIAPNIPTFKNGTTYSIATTVQPLSGTVEYYSTTKGE